MTKFLLTTAGVAAVLTLLSGGRRYVGPSPAPSLPGPISKALGP